MTFFQPVIKTALAIYQHFDIPPAVIDRKNYRFYVVSNVGQTLAWSTHTIWLILFWILGIYPLALLQVLSILTYVLAINLNRRAYHMASMTVSLLEICIHQALLVYALGWESAFQYFIPAVAVFPFLKSGGQWTWKSILFAMCLSFYIGMDFFIRKSIPIYTLEPGWMGFFHYSNILVAFGCFALWAYYISVAIDRSDKVIEEKNKNIIRSIEYAQRIQGAMLPDLGEFSRLWPEHFIIYKPRDIVSGDFYLIEEIGEWKYLAVADCTGHGVPGALMSMICMEKLRDYIQLSLPPHEVLQQSNLKIRKVLGQNLEDRTTHDGMDVALIRYQKQGDAWQLEFAGAGRPLWIQKANQPTIEELKGTNTGIGGSTPDLQAFKLTTLSLHPGDSLYFFTDGYTDQFSEASRKKITTRRLKEMLEIHHALPMEQKGVQLDQFLQQWQGDFMQIDDILVVGLKLS